MGNNGWFGSESALLCALGIVECDRDGDRYCVSGTIVKGMDGDIVVGADARYYLDGEPRNLAALLRGTSQGLAVVVL